jgi:hypothetical protein
MRFKKSGVLIFLLTTHVFSENMHNEKVVLFKKNSIACDRTVDLENISEIRGSHKTSLYKSKLVEMSCIVIPLKKKYKIISHRKNTELNDHIINARKNDPFIEIMDMKTKDAVQSKWTYAHNVK